MDDQIERDDELDERDEELAEDEEHDEDEADEEEEASTVVEFSGARARAARADREVRAGTIQVRDGGGSSSTVDVYGYASATEQPYMVQDWLGEYEETIARDAFDKTLQEADVRFYIDHEGIALARSSAGNLQLSVDDYGLAYEAQLPGKVSVVQDLAELMRAGVIKESSFAFQTVRDSWNKDYSKRRVEEVKLIDVSTVSMPANPAASAGIRAALAVRRLAPELWTPELGQQIAAAAREGKVLSATNAALVRDVIDMLQGLLDAAAPAQSNDGRDAGAMMRANLVEVTRRRR